MYAVARVAIITASLVFLSFIGCARDSSRGLIRVVEEPEQRLPDILVSELPHDKQLSKTVTLVNDSDGETSISIASKNCGCTRVWFGEQPWEKGENKQIAAHAKQVVTLSRAVARSQVSAAAVFTALIDDNRPQHVKLSVTKRVLPDVELEPPILRCVFEAADDQYHVVRAHFIARDAEHLQRCELRAETLPSGVEVVAVDTNDVTSLEADMCQKTYAAKLRVSPSDFLSRKGNHEAQLTFQYSSSEGQATVTLPIVATAKYGLQQPGTVVFGGVEVGKRGHRRILVKSNSGEEFTVDSIEASFPFSATRSALGPSNAHWLDAFFDPTSTGRVNGKLNIHTSCKDGPVIEVDLVGVCLRDS